MDTLWKVFCGNSDCKEIPCTTDLVVSITQPCSCINHAFVICFNTLLIIMVLFNIIQNKSSELQNYHRSSKLQTFSATYNSVLAVAYLCLGFWSLFEEIKLSNTSLPLHSWSVSLVQGLAYLLLVTSRKFSSWTSSVLAFSIPGFTGGLSLFALVSNKQVSVKVVLDLLSLIGGTLWLLCTYKNYKDIEIDTVISDVYTPLIPELNGCSTKQKFDSVTPLSKAGVFSKLWFQWLNPLMKSGKEKTLCNEDIPLLQGDDRAESCYSQFLDNFHKQESSILNTIFQCHSKEILISGLYALVKIITVSSGPLILNAFIEVAEGKGSFRYEGYVLAISLFLAKTLESLAQRQWFFRSRLIGLKVRSFLIAAIYKKQLRLSNAAKLTHSSGEITNYVILDAYRIGEFPVWFHQLWTTSLQLCFSLLILYKAVGFLATIASLVVIILTVLSDAPLVKLQHKFLSRLMMSQDNRIKASLEALVNMKVLKLYGWEGHFKTRIENLRKVECKWLSALLLKRAFNNILFWSAPVFVSTATFLTCYIVGIPLYASNVFTTAATLRLTQQPIRSIPDVVGVAIQAGVSFVRIVKFLEAPELDNSNIIRQKCNTAMNGNRVSIKSASFSWDEKLAKATIRNVNLEVRPGKKVAICGEVGSGKSTLLASILGEIPNTKGIIQVYGSTAYVSQSAWIQTGTLRDNILFGAAFDKQRYQETLAKCSLMKDLELLPHGDLTEIGERGVNLSGGQKQRIQLARALYQNADIYLLDDPFSAVDAHTATSLFNEYVMGALSEKTVLLVTHQVDFLPTFDSVLLMSDGEISQAASYQNLLDSSQEFHHLVQAHKETAGTDKLAKIFSCRSNKTSQKEKNKSHIERESENLLGDQLIRKEERETGSMGLKPYIQYLNQNKGYLISSMIALSHLTFTIGQILQSSWMAGNLENPNMSTLKLILVYLLIGCSSTLFLIVRSLSIVALGLQSSRSLFSQLLTSLFRAPMSFYDSTPLGRILSRVSADLSIVDVDIPFTFAFTITGAMTVCSSLVLLAVVTWPVLFVSIPMIYLTIRIQGYYFASAKELMRINGTTKSSLANHLAESIAGSMTIRAFKEEERFFAKNLNLIDRNASPLFHSFSANEWLILRLEILSAIVLSSSALCMVLFPPGTFSAGVIGMALSYSLSINSFLVETIEIQCALENYIVSVERMNQYMHIPSEAPQVIAKNTPPPTWPTTGEVEIQNLQIRYRPDSELVLRGISCTFEGGHKIGVVGRTGSGKSTLISALFRLVEPASGKIVIDGIDISTLGLHDLRSQLGIIPQDPTLFNGTVRFNLDPLYQYTDQEIWEVLAKCQLKDAVAGEEKGLDSSVVEDGSNWSMGQRQLFCLGRALLRRSKILVLDEATASIDNATDLVLQRTIRTEFADCTVVTVAHRIPTVMDCTMVLAISDGKLVEYDEPMKLVKREDSLFGQLVKEYWSRSQNSESH